MNKGYYLEKAIEITKEWARGGVGSGGYDGPAEVLEKTYEKLIKLGKEIEE